MGGSHSSRDPVWSPGIHQARAGLAAMSSPCHLLESDHEPGLLFLCPEAATAPGKEREGQLLAGGPATHRPGGGREAKRAHPSPRPPSTPTTRAAGGPGPASPQKPGRLALAPAPPAPTGLALPTSQPGMLSLPPPGIPKAQGPSELPPPWAPSPTSWASRPPVTGHIQPAGNLSRNTATPPHHRRISQRRGQSWAAAEPQEAVLPHEATACASAGPAPSLWGLGSRHGHCGPSTGAPAQRPPSSHPRGRETHLGTAPTLLFVREECGAAWSAPRPEGPCPAGVGAALSKEPMDLGGTKTLKAPSLPSCEVWLPGRRPSHQPGPGALLFRPCFVLLHQPFQDAVKSTRCVYCQRLSLACQLQHAGIVTRSVHKLPRHSRYSTDTWWMKA